MTDPIVVKFQREIMVNNPRLFALSTVLIIFVASFFAIHSWLSALTVPLTNAAPDENAVVLVVAMNNADPLILSVHLTSNFYRALSFSKSYIMDYNQTVVAECRGKFYGGYLSGHVEPLIKLPAKSEKTLALNFNTVLSSGNYTLWLPFGEPPHTTFISPHFTIP